MFSAVSEALPGFMMQHAQGRACFEQSVRTSQDDRECMAQTCIAPCLLRESEGPDKERCSSALHSVCWGQGCCPALSMLVCNAELQLP